MQRHGYHDQLLASNRIAVGQARPKAASPQSGVRTPWPGTALDSQGLKNNNPDQTMTICFNDYATMKVSSAFILYSSMKDSKDFTVGNTIVHVISSQKTKIESHAVLGYGIPIPAVRCPWDSSSERDGYKEHDTRARSLLSRPCQQQ